MLFGLAHMMMTEGVRIKIDCQKNNKLDFLCAVQIIPKIIY